MDSADVLFRRGRERHGLCIGLGGVREVFGSGLEGLGDVYRAGDDEA